MAQTLVICDASLDFTDAGIGRLSIEGDGERELLLEEDYMENHPQISPDGQWITYWSNETDEWEIFVRPFPEVHQNKWRVSIGDRVQVDLAGFILNLHQEAPVAEFPLNSAEVQRRRFLLESRLLASGRKSLVRKPVDAFREACAFDVIGLLHGLAVADGVNLQPGFPWRNSGRLR